MRTTLYLCLLASIACGPPPASRKVKDPAELKSRLTVLAATQRADRKWMLVDDCPVDTAPQNSRSNVRSNECRALPEACLTECEAGDGSACWSLGRLIQDNGKPDEDVADVLFRKACRLGIASGCTNAAALLDERRTPGSTECVARTFEYSCNHKDPWGCTMHGVFLAEGDGRSRDLVSAVAAFDRACEFSLEPTFEACVRANELKALYSREGNQR